MHRTGKRGLGLSYLDGFRWAIAHEADLICQMDADLSHDPRFLPDLVKAADTYDLVLGSRYLNGISVDQLAAQADPAELVREPVRPCHHRADDM